MTHSLPSDKAKPQMPRLLHRQRQLLGLLGSLGGSVQATDFQKLLFLYCQEQRAEGSVRTGASTYDFVPYRYGAFSFTCYADWRRLIARGLLVDDQGTWILSAMGGAVADAATDSWEQAFARRYRGLRGDALIAETYRRYPYYASRSQITRRVLGTDPKALRRIESARSNVTASRLLTIGYEGLTLETYLNALLQAGATVLCDVRRNAISRKYGFSKTTLERACRGVGLGYTHMPELGIDSSQRRGVETPGDLRALFMWYKRNTLPSVSDAIQRITNWLNEGKSVALTCFEHQARDCHRHCVAESIAQRGYTVEHIRER